MQQQLWGQIADGGATAALRCAVTGDGAAILLMLQQLWLLLLCPVAVLGQGIAVILHKQAYVLAARGAHVPL
jgi:hypothetical protein